MADRTDGGPITQRFAVFRDPENPPDSWRSWSAYTRDFNVEWRGFAGFYEGHGDTRRARKSDAIRRARIDAMTKHAAPTPAPRDVWQHDETGRIVELPAGSPSPGKRYYRVRGMGGDVSVVGRGDEARVVFTPDARPTRPTPPAPDAAHPALIAAARERDELRERAEKAEARTMPTSREQVVTFLHAVAGHDATLSPPTDEMIDGVWALCKHPATTPLTLAVVAYERGRNFAAMKASAEKAERERDDWRDTSMAAVAAAHGLDWQKVTNEQIDAMEADGKAHGDKKAMDAVRRLYARWNAAVYDADKVRVERDRAEKERDEARESAAAAWRLLDEHRNGCVWITWHKEAEERANAATARAERAEAELRKREAGA